MAVLETLRLRLREFVQDDLAVLHPLVSDPACLTLSRLGTQRAGRTTAFLAGAVRESQVDPRQGYSLVMVLKGGDRSVGSCAVWVDSEQRRRGG